MNNNVDIVVIGGGLVGASLLIGLSNIFRNNNIKITLIESKSKFEPKFGDQLKNNIIDQRSLVLSLSSKLFFNKIGIWNKIAEIATIINNIKISEQGKFSKLFLDSNHLGLDSLGYIVNIDELDNIIWQELAKKISSHYNINILANTNVEIVDNNMNKVDLLLKDKNNNKSKISANLVIAADGCNSNIRSQINIDNVKIDYNQTAVVANIEHELENKNTAYERFLSVNDENYINGSFAVLPHNNRCKNNNISGIVWAVGNSIENNNIDCIKNLSDKNLCKKINNIIGYKLGKIYKIGARQYFNLSEIRARELYKNRVILLGSAANHVHPIGGQGFNLGVRDVQCLCNLFEKHKQELIHYNYNINIINKLYDNYKNLRISDHDNLTKNINNLLNTFASNNIITKLARSFGIMVANHSFILKSIIAERSMGLDIIYE